MIPRSGEVGDGAEVQRQAPDRAAAIGRTTAQVTIPAMRAPMQRIIAAKIGMSSACLCGRIQMNFMSGTAPAR